MNHDENKRPRRQDQVPEFADTGAVYAMRMPGFKVSRHRFFGRIAIFEVPREHEFEIDAEIDLALAEALLGVSTLRRDSACLPTEVAGVAFDFDGVLTDNRVLTYADGAEAVVCDRSDGLGIEMLRHARIPMVVISKESHPVVAARCAKIGLQLLQGVDDKISCFSDWIAERRLDVSGVVFVGNDANDAECLRFAGCGVAVADAHTVAIAASDLVLSRPGGAGAVRELADLILSRPTKGFPCPEL